MAKRATFTPETAAFVAKQAMYTAGLPRNPRTSSRRGGPPVYASFLARITGVSGSFPKWTYTVQRLTAYDASLTGAARAVTDGDSLTAYNGFELVTGTAPYTHAAGVTISNATDGSVNSGSCKIKSIAVGAVVWVVPVFNASADGSVTYLFSVPNSAQ
jgi:hypothetical protein